jgi:hypothetical protein
MRYLKHLACMGIGWDDGKQQIINRNNSVVKDRVVGIKSRQRSYEDILHNQSNSASYVVPRNCKKRHTKQFQGVRLWYVSQPRVVECAATVRILIQEPMNLRGATQSLIIGELRPRIK